MRSGIFWQAERLSISF